jgi:hypothetical protein
VHLPRPTQTLALDQPAENASVNKRASYVMTKTVGRTSILPEQGVATQTVAPPLWCCPVSERKLRASKAKHKVEDVLSKITGVTCVLVRVEAGQNEWDLHQPGCADCAEARSLRR